MKSLPFISSTSSVLVFLYCCQYVAAGTFSNTTTTTTAGKNVPTGIIPTACGLPTCRIHIKPKTLTYPTIFALVEQTQVATVIPVIKVFPNGDRTTITSTFNHYNTADGSNQTFVTPNALALTWETLGTTLTWPTTYVAYPSPTLVLKSPTPTKNRNDDGCGTTSIAIEIPKTATTQLIFAATDRSDKFPGTVSAFSVLDALPTITALLSGGNPVTCYHGTPTDQSRTAEFNTPAILPQVPIFHTTTSILTSVGRPVTFTVPFDDGGSVPTVNTGGQIGGDPTDLPQSQDQGTQTEDPRTTTPPAQVTKIIVGSDTIQQVPSGIVVNGQTFSPGMASTLSDGVVVSVALSTTIVVIGGQTVSLPEMSGLSGSPGTSTSAQGPGAAIASGMGISGAAENSGSWLIALEGFVVFTIPGVLAML